MDYIRVRGAKTHNLKNIDVDIPRNTLTVITGLSGSGKSSLAFDTIYAEGQRRYVESLSTYARQFLQTTEKPDVESIDGLSPAISIDQKTAPRNPRSTVGTVTEIYDYLRLLFAKVGTPHCPVCDTPVESQSPTQIVDTIAEMKEGTKIYILAPIIRDKKGEHQKVFEMIKKEGFVRMRVDGTMMTIAEEFQLDPKKKHTIEIVVDRLTVKDLGQRFRTLPSGEEIPEPNPDRTRLVDSVETALRFGEGLVTVLEHDSEKEHTYSEKLSCPKHPEVQFPEITPRAFSFNSPQGACDTCHGLGEKQEVDPELIVQNPKLSLDEGALAPWATSAHQQNWFHKILRSVARKHKFSLDTPFEELSEDVKQLLFFGASDEQYKVSMESDSFKGDYNTRFEGVIPNLQRRYMETDSDFVRRKIEEYMRIIPCGTCHGNRLKKEVLGVKINTRNIIDVTRMSVEESLEFFGGLKLTKSQTTIANAILKEVKERLEFLVNVGLAYLSLERKANTLSGGEAQRIRLATQIGSKLQGVLYVLDEPSIGLHQKDNDRLIKTLTDLRDLGNTVIVVEHDEDTIHIADYLIDIGPGAGREGGNVIATGTPKEVAKNKDSVTGPYISGKKVIEVPNTRRTGNGNFLTVVGAKEHNLRDVTVDIPLGCFVSVTGVSGSGKSTLINDILVNTIEVALGKQMQERPGAHDDILGLQHIDKLINIDQSPIGRTPRSNPATYTGVFTDIRELFTKTNEARMRGYKPGRFSFNVRGGRCEACQGDGLKKIEMHFLPDIYVPCEVCDGKRYNKETLEVTYRGKSIADVLDMTVSEAYEFFNAIPQIEYKMATLMDVGLNYIKLGQSATTLSGGEAQRIKLATELARKSTGKTFYVLDEPTTGLHFADVEKLLDVLQRLVDKGNTVLIIEHNMDMIKSSDWVIDLGPEGGVHGGQIVAVGTPEKVSEVKGSYTGQWLQKVMGTMKPVKKPTKKK